MEVQQDDDTGAGSYGGESGPSGPRAGFWQRFAASILDGLVVNLVGLPLVLALDTVIAQVANVLIAIIYFSMLEGGPTGQTLGKRALGIRVIDFERGGPIGIGRGAIRYFGRIVSTIPLLLGYFWMLWDQERRTWHDKFATAVVVPVSDYPVGRA